MADPPGKPLPGALKGPPRPIEKSPAPQKAEVITTDLDADELEDDLGSTGSSGQPIEAKKIDPPKGPPPRTRPPVPAPRSSGAPPAKSDASTSGSIPRPPATPSMTTPSAGMPRASASTSGTAPLGTSDARSNASSSTPALGRRPSMPIPAPRNASPALARAATPQGLGPSQPRPPTTPPPAATRDRSRSFEHPPKKVEINLAPSESMAKAAERPLATQPGVASMQVQRAKSTAAEVAKHVTAARAKGKASDQARVTRLLVEEALAWERAEDLPRAMRLFGEAIDSGVPYLPAVQGAVRTSREAPLARRLELLEKEAAIVSKEGTRADLLVERARILEAEKPDDLEGILAAYRGALDLCPGHAEALKGLEGALLRARARKDAKKDGAWDDQLAEHCGRLASAYGQDPELVASYLSTRARLLEERGDAVSAEEAYAAALAADGRVGPVREAYKRLLQKRKAWAKLRDVLAEEAGREHDLARSVRLLYEAARISLERQGDAAQAIQLLEHAASRAPTDPSVDARVLDELVRLLEARGDARAAATHRRALLEHETDPAVRALGLRRLAADFEALGDPDSAIAALSTALTIEPLHLPTQLALDRLYEARGHHEARVRLWLDEAAKARDPQRRAAAYVRAAHVAEDALARPDEALEYLRAAWVTDTGNVSALDELTRLLLPPNEVRHGIGGGEGRSARALIELFSQAAQTTREPARKIAYLEKVAALWEDALGNPAEAAKVYEKVLALEPTRRFALLALQRAHERSGDFKALAAAIETEAAQATDAKTAAALHLRAAETWSERAGDPDRAVAIVKKVLEKSPDDATALRALLKAHEAAGRWEEVAKTLEKMIAAIKGPDSVPLWIELGEIRRRRLGRIDDAIAAWRAALSHEPQHPVATRELSHALRTRGTWKPVAELEETIAKTATEPAAIARAWVRAAEIWEGRLDDDERAQTAYANALSARPTDLSAWDGLARLAERRGALDDLAAAYRLRIEREEADGHPRLALRIALGELLARKGDDLQTAAIALEQVVLENPTHVASLRLLEAIYRRTRNEVALAKTLTALAQATKDPLAKRGVLWELVRLQERTDEGVAASPPIAAYLLIYELDASDEAALRAIVRLAMERLRADHQAGGHTDGLPNVRGLLAFGLRKQIAAAPDLHSKITLELRLADLLEDTIERREQAEALALYRDALLHDGESPTAIAGLLRVATNLADVPAQLLAELRAADIALDRASKVAHLLRAAELAPKVAAPEGGETVAIDLVTRALREDPDSAEAAAAASALLLSRNDVRRLVDVLMEAASAAKRPDRIVALAREGAHHAATSLDNVPVAIALLSQGRKADPRDPTLLVELGDLYVQQRAWAEAARAYQEGCHSAREDALHALQVRGHRALAALYEGPLDDPQKALDELKVVCTLAPDDVDAQRRLASALSAKGDLDGALKALATLVKSPSLPAREQVSALLSMSDLRLQKGDVRGAEQSLRQAIRLDPDPAGATFQRFEAFHARHGGDAALAAALAEMLVEDRDADARWLRLLGEIEVHRLGRPTEGVARLRQAVQAATEGRGDLSAAQLSYGEGLLAMGAADDAARALRDLLQRDPTHAQGLDAAHRAYVALGRRDEVLVVEEIRAYFGYEGSAATFRARRLPPTPPRPQVLEDVAIHSHVMPPSARTTAYEVLHAVADQLIKVYPPEIGALGLSSRDKLGPRSGHPFRAMVDRAATALGVPELDLYVHDAPDQRILVENTEPPALVVPRSLETLPELEIAFALGRLVAKAATRTYLADKLPVHELEDLLHAATEPFGGPAPRARHADVEELSRRVQKAVSRKTRRQLEEIAPRFTRVDGALFARALDQGVIRTGYLLTGDLTSAVDHLRRYDPSAMNDLGAGSQIGDLLRFALSSDAAALRRRLGTSWG